MILAFPPTPVPARSASVHNPPSVGQNSVIGAPKILVITPHLGIGAGLEALLQLERYEVRRIARPADRASLADWKPDAVLIDGALLREPVPGFGVPTLILAGNVADADELSRGMPDARGWLPKDVTAAQLRDRLAEVAHAEPVPAARPALRIVAAALLTLFLLAVVIATAFALGIAR